MTGARYTFFTIMAREQSPKRKTRDYDILDRRGNPLGSIEYYSSWRQHVLAPEPGTVWSAGCLADANDFLAKLKVSEATR